MRRDVETAWNECRDESFRLHVLYKHSFPESQCTSAGCKNDGPALFSCEVCDELDPKCQDCITAEHRNKAPHKLRKFCKELGFSSFHVEIELRAPFLSCQCQKQSTRLVLVKLTGMLINTLLETNNGGASDAVVYYCGCTNLIHTLLKSGYYPDNPQRPIIAFNEDILQSYLIQLRESKIAISDFILNLSSESTRLSLAGSFILNRVFADTKAYP